MVSIDFAGLEKLLAKLEKVENGIELACSDGVRQITSKAQVQAKLLAPVDAGELRESIKTRFSNDGDTLIGEVFTNKNYAAYVEFGTGPNGEASGPELPEGVNITYSQNGWIIPASAMDEEKAKGYGFGVLRNKDGVVIGYMTNGQRAQPYMVPASRYAESIAQEEMKTAIERAISKVRG